VSSRLVITPSSRQLNSSNWNTGRNFSVVAADDQQFYATEPPISFGHVATSSLGTGPLHNIAQCSFAQIRVTDNDDSDCGDRIVNLVSSLYYPFVQEPIDMGVVNSFQARILVAPTYNASSVTVINPSAPSAIAWGNPIRVYRRVQFTQAGFTPQTWYEVSRPSDTSPIGWILVRADGVAYVRGSDPCANPSASMPVVTSSTPITFVYDRAAVREYAVRQSYANRNGGPGPNRVTRRLSPDVRFANFSYSDLNPTSTPPATGSALFVSETIWMGGLPMVFGNSGSCGLTPSNTVSDYGWRYCVTSANLPGPTSPPWDYHEALGEYYINDAFYFVGTQLFEGFRSGGSGPNNVLGVPISSNRGFQIRFPNQVTGPEDRLYRATVDPYVSLSIGIVNLPSQFIDDIVEPYLGADANNANLLRAGDYIFINSVENGVGDYHGLIVVGWQSVINCADNISRPDLASNAFYVSYNDALADTTIPRTSLGNALVVPYVADYTTVQQPIPRPFYCTRYRDPNLLNFVNHDWWFYRLPNSITITKSTIYVDELWQWSNP
jgi:hypothetical protein